MYVPDFDALNHVSLTRPGIASILPPSAGIHHEWMTSVSGDGDVELHGDAGRGAQVVDRDRAVRVLELPVELASRHRHVELLLAGRRAGMSLIPGSSMKTKAAIRKRITTGTAVHSELEVGRAVDLRAVLEARPLAPAVAEDEDHEQRLDHHEDDEREERDEEVAVADLSAFGDSGETGANCASAEGATTAASEHEAERNEETAHRLPFYERAPRLVPGNSRPPAGGSRAAVRGLRERHRAVGGERLSASRAAPSSSSAS